MFGFAFLLIFLPEVTKSAKKSCKNTLYATPEPLTMADAVCPDDTTWYMADYYKDTPRCYGLWPIPQNLTKPTDLLEVCTEKNAKALPASIHSEDEHFFVYNNSMDGGLIGLYLPSGKSYALANFKNMDGTAVDYHPLTATTGSSTLNIFAISSMKFSPAKFEDYTSSVNTNVICTMWAERAT